MVLAHLFVKRQSILMVVFASSFGILITKYLIQNSFCWEKTTVYAYVMARKNWLCLPSKSDCLPRYRG
jgi:hypothetical protein